MPVPKKRTSRSRRDQRRSHDALVFTTAIQACPSCGELKRSHHVCPACGTYKNEKVFEVARSE